MEKSDLKVSYDSLDSAIADLVLQNELLESYLNDIATEVATLDNTIWDSVAKKKVIDDEFAAFSKMFDVIVTDAKSYSTFLANASATYHLLETNLVNKASGETE